MINITEIKVRLTFTEDILGSQSGDPEITRTYIASKSEDAKKIEEEVAAIGVDGVEEKKMTVFPRMEDGTPCLWDYQIKGFFKSACEAYNKIDPDNKLTAYKKNIDKYVFVKERKIPFTLPDDGKMGSLQRPLRGMTAQGERISLANSETIPAGSQVEFTIEVLEPDKVQKKNGKAELKLSERVLDWLYYGRWNGLGCWRNASYGRFKYEKIA